MADGSKRIWSHLRPCPCSALRQYRHQGHLKQCTHGIQVPWPWNERWQTGSGRSCIWVLGHCIRHCLSGSSSEQYGRIHCRSFHFTIILHLPTCDVPRVPDQKGGISKRRGSRPSDFTDGSCWRRHEEMDQRRKAKRALEQPPFNLLLGIIDYGRTGLTLVYRWPRDKGRKVRGESVSL